MALLSQKTFESPHAPTWCPGCGNFGIWTALKNAFAVLKVPPHKILMVYGVGCSGNMANTIATYGWHSLHGRTLPTAIGAKLANKGLTVVAAGGDGDGYGEGVGHFIHALRGNVDVTYIVHDNSIYGLTTGQAAPTTRKGMKTKSTPDGLIDEPLNPLAVAIATGGTFVARGFASDVNHLTKLFIDAINHRGFSLVDVFQPCVTFNKVDTYQYYNQKIVKLDAAAALSDRTKAFAEAIRTDMLPIGVLFKSDARPRYEDELSYLPAPLVSKPATRRTLTKRYRDFI